MLPRIVSILVLVGLLGLWGAKCGHRPGMLPLATSVDGPSPAAAVKVLVMLHGHGGSGSTTDWIVPELRARGVGPDTAIVMVDGPFSASPGRGWGMDPAEQDESLTRVSALIEGYLGENGGLRVVVAGFSRGADMAVRLAANTPGIAAVAALSGCQFADVPMLAARPEVGILVAHASNDSVCPNRNSVVMVETLRKVGHPVEFVEHAADHSIPGPALDALAKLLTR
jgi:predicted esterase